MRRDVHVLDVSLRDGSHSMKHAFTVEQVKSIARGLDQANIEYFEVAHGDGLGGSSLQYGLSAVDELKLKEIFAEQPIRADGSIDYYGQEDIDSTWKRVLGFKNLYHLFEYHENNGLEPDFKRYMDPYRDWLYFRDDWRNTICRYYETGDRRYLQMFWDRGKDTDTERKYLPLEAYGTNPIL